MKFTKFFLVVAFIFAVVGSSVAAPVVGAVANKAAQLFGQEATEKAIVRVLGKEALIKVSNKMGEHALKSAVKKEAAKKAAEEAAKKTAQKAAEKAAAKLAAKEAAEKAAEETAKKAAQKAAEKAAARKAAEEGGKQISKKKVAGAVIGTGAVAGTGVWGFNQFNKAGAQPADVQPKTE